MLHATVADDHPPAPGALGAPLAACVFAAVALLSLAQGLGEFTLPLLLGGEPFALTRAAAEQAGPGGLFAGILLHNLGLALLLPGCGLLAACRERDPRNRRLLGPILLAALAGAVSVGLATVVATAPPERVPFLLALAAGEACAIFVVAFATHREMRGLVAARRVGVGARIALRNLRPTLALATAALAGLALAETWFLHAAFS